VRLSLDVRSVAGDVIRGVIRDLVRYAERAAAERGATTDYAERQRLEPTPLDDGLAARLEEAARQAGEPHLRMPSSALHDTALVAAHVPSTMLFVPCEDGISHSPRESARVADAALAVGIALTAFVAAEGGN